jgi:Rad3-related DNA helicase
VMGRDYIIFDEADQLPDMAALQSDFTINKYDLAELNIQLTTATETLNKIIALPPAKVEQEVRAAAKVMLEVIQEPRWYAQAGLGEDGDIVLTHRLPGRLLKKIANKNNVAFVSATLSINGKFNDFKNALGIECESVLSDKIEPAQHGNLEFTVQDLEVDTDDWFTALAQTVEAAERPCLVVTTSNDLANQLTDQVKDKTDLVIKAAAWAGLDLPLRFKSVIVPRVPFSKPIFVDGDVTTSYLDARNTATRRMRQAVGRGLRTPDQNCHIYILDKRVSQVSQFVPTRFLSQWIARNKIGFDEGGRTEVVLSQAERSPVLRSAALKHYGCKCQHDGCTVDQAHQLDVHHLDPVSEGVRRTTLADVMVLCKNHHAEAHFLMKEKGKTVVESLSCSA